MGRIYTQSFTDVAVTEVQDLFQIRCLVSSIKIHEISLSQRSDLGNDNAESLKVILKAVTANVTNDVTPAKRDGGDVASGCSVAVNETAQLGSLLYTYSVIDWDISYPFFYSPEPKNRINLKFGVSFRTFVVDLATAPADEITMSGSMIWEEFGS
jgi:hypothetical protein